MNEQVGNTSRETGALKNKKEMNTRNQKQYNKGMSSMGSSVVQTWPRKESVDLKTGTSQIQTQNQKKNGKKILEQNINELCL